MAQPPAVENGEFEGQAKRMRLPAGNTMRALFTITNLGYTRARNRVMGASFSAIQSSVALPAAIRGNPWTHKFPLRRKYFTSS
jgi:hypothetical protein